MEVITAALLLLGQWFTFNQGLSRASIQRHKIEDLEPAGIRPLETLIDKEFIGDDIRQLWNSIPFSKE